MITHVMQLFAVWLVTQTYFSASVLCVAPATGRGIYVVTSQSLTAVVSEPVTPPIVGFTVDPLGRMLAFTAVELTATPASDNATGRIQRHGAVSNASGYFTFDVLVIRSCVADNETFRLSFNSSGGSSNESLLLTVLPNPRQMMVDASSLPPTFILGRVVPQVVFAVRSTCGSPLRRVPRGGVLTASVNGSFVGRLAASLTGRLEPLGGNGSSSGIVPPPSSSSNGTALVVTATFINVAADLRPRNASGSFVQTALLSVALESLDGSAGFGSFPVSVMLSPSSRSVRTAFWLTRLPPTEQENALRAAVLAAQRSTTLDNATHFDQTEAIATFTRASSIDGVTIASLTTQPVYLVIVSNCSVDGGETTNAAGSTMVNTVQEAGGRLLFTAVNGLDVNPRGILYALNQPDFVSAPQQFNISTVTPVGNVFSRSFLTSFRIGPLADIGAEVGDTVTVTLTSIFLVAPYIVTPSSTFRFAVFPVEATLLERLRSVMSIAAIVNPDIAFISTLIVQLDCTNGQSGPLDFAVHPLQVGIGSTPRERYRRSAQVSNVILILFTSLLSVVGHLLLPAETRLYYVPHVALWVSRVLFPGTMFVTISVFVDATDGVDYTLFVVGIMFASALIGMSASIANIVCPKYTGQTFRAGQGCLYRVLAPLGEYDVCNTDHVAFRYLFSELQGTKMRKFFFLVDYILWIVVPAVCVLFPCGSRHVYVLCLVASQLLIVIAGAPYISITLNALHVVSGGVKCTALVYLMWPDQSQAFRTMLSALVCAMGPLSCVLFVLRNVLPWVVGRLRGSGQEEWRVVLAKPDHSLAKLMSELSVFAAEPDDEMTAEEEMSLQDRSSAVALVASEGGGSIRDDTSTQYAGPASSFVRTATVGNASFRTQTSVEASRAPSTPAGSQRLSVRPVTTIRAARAHWRQLWVQRAEQRDEEEEREKHSRFHPSHDDQAPPMQRVMYSPEKQRFVEIPIGSNGADAAALPADAPPEVATDAAEVPRPSSSGSPFATRLREGSFLHQRLLELQGKKLGGAPVAAFH